jgi:uncharacterized YccA/Bax inhibitor family protein
MANPALNEKRFQEARDEEWAPGWAAPDGASAPAETAATPATEMGRGPVAPPPGVKVMTANATFAKTFVLFLVVLAGGAFGWSQTDISVGKQVELPGWIWICLFAAMGLAFWTIFRPKVGPFTSPFYALLEGVFLGSISKAFEAQWHGIVFQAVLATVGVFFATLALYVFGVVKVTRRFQMVVVGATFGILLLYLFGFLLNLFGVDVVFWNDPSPLGIIVSVVICCVAALNLFLNYEFIRQASVQGAPSYMEWYGAFGIMVTLVWLYLEVLRLLSLLRR